MAPHKPAKSKNEQEHRYQKNWGLGKETENARAGVDGEKQNKYSEREGTREILPTEEESTL